jgi:hypothetical protein
MLNKMSDLIIEGTPRLDDILDLKAAGKITVPTKKESQVNHTMQAFWVVLAVWLGLPKECCRAYRTEIVDKFEKVQPKLETLAEMHPNKPVYAKSYAGSNYVSMNTGLSSSFPSVT